VEIDKPDGGKRQLGIPTIIDRVIQQSKKKDIYGRSRYVNALPISSC
jgi:retron-type reverse transcriptase